MSTNHKKTTLLDQWFFVKALVSDPKLSRTAAACGFHLTDLYNKRKEYAWPSYDTLAKLTGSHRRTVIDAVKKLLERKYFTVERGNGRRSNHYRPNFALANKGSEGSTTGDENVSPPVAETTPLDDIEVAEKSPYTSYSPVAPSVGDIEVSPRSAGSSAQRAPSPSRGAPPGFEAFWKVYPKKEGRKATKTAYALAIEIEGVTPELLAAKAAQYAEAKEGTDPKWIKMPKNWLDEECWLEDPQPRSSANPKAGAKKPKKPTAQKSAKSKSAATSKPAAKRQPVAQENTLAEPRKPAAKKKPKRRGRKKGKSKLPGSFYGYFPLYCNYLGVTLEDLATATDVPYRFLKRCCAGKVWMNPDMADRLRALVIEAVLYMPKNEPSAVDWLAIWFELNIQEEPPKKYNWRLPENYEKDRPK